MIQLKLDPSLSRRAFALNTRYALWNGAAFGKKWSEWELTLNPYRTTLTKSEWQKEYNTLFHLTEEAIEKKKGFVHWLSQEEKRILEEYKLAMLAAGPFTQDDVEKFLFLHQQNIPDADEEEKTRIEQYKLAIMRKMLKDIETQFGSSNTVSLLKEEEKKILEKELNENRLEQYNIHKTLHSDNPIKIQSQAQLNALKQKEQSLKESLKERQPAQFKETLLLWIGFYTLMAIDFAPMIISGIVYARNAFDFLPFPLPVSLETAVGLLLNFTELAMMYAFVSPILKERLGLPDNSKRNLASTCEEKIDVVNRINASLSTVPIVNQISHDEYQFYAKFAQQLNDDLDHTHKHFPSYQESMAIKILRLSMTVINLIHNTFGVLFMAKSCLAVIAPALSILSPLGIFFIAAVAGGQLMSRIIYRSSSLFVIMNPFAQQQEKTKLKLSFFRRKNSVEFKEVLNQKKFQEEVSCQQEMVLMRQMDQDPRYRVQEMKQDHSAVPVAANSASFYNHHNNNNSISQNSQVHQLAM